MLVESRKSFRHGFVLTEADLRRIIDTINDQFEKLPEKPEYDLKYDIKFRNGVIAETTSLENVLSQENSGSAQIIRLRLKFSVIDASNKIETTVEFVNVDLEDDNNYKAVKYIVLGQTRDWVFITSSLLEERIAKVKRFAFNQLLNKSRSISGSFLRMSFPIFVMFLLIPLSLMFIPNTNLIKQKESLDVIEQKWKDGAIKDSIEAILLIEKNKISQSVDMNLSAVKPMIFIGCGLMALILIFLFIYKYYPIFNFCWGDYEEIFKKKESTRKFIIVVILVGISVSFIGGILANTIGKNY